MTKEEELVYLKNRVKILEKKLEEEQSEFNELQIKYYKMEFDFDDKIQYFSDRLEQITKLRGSSPVGFLQKI